MAASLTARRIAAISAAEWRAWHAYVQRGSVKRAAQVLGLHEGTVKRHLRGVRTALGVETNVQAAIVLGVRPIDDIP